MSREIEKRKAGVPEGDRLIGFYFRIDFALAGDVTSSA